MPAMATLRMVAAQLFLTALAAAENWQDWPECPASAASFMEEEDEVSLAKRRRLAELDFAAHKARHQIASINNETGKLQVLHEAAIWEEMRQTPAQVNVIVIYGDRKNGQSTLASFLNCAMNKERATLFPARHEEDANSYHTEGIWASDPFEYKPAGQTVAKTFMIFDLQGLNPSASTSKQVEHALILQIAAMTEVASTFVFSHTTSTIGRDENLKITSAFKTTRDTLVRSGEDLENPIDSEKRIKSTNHPRMMVALRPQRTDNFIDDDLQFMAEDYKNMAKAAFADSNMDADTKTMMLENFEKHTEGEDSWAYLFHPLPEVQMPSDPFRWVTRDPFAWEPAGACNVYDQMVNESWKCTMETGGRVGKGPSSPHAYQAMLHLLAEQVYNAPARMVSWGEQTEPLQLTGDRLKGFMEAMFEEMNGVGPLPDTELWRVIMQDRCFHELGQLVNNTYGSTSATGLLYVLGEEIRPSKIAEMTAADIAQLNTSHRTRWNGQVADFQNLIAGFFSKPDNSMMRVVQEECTVEGDNTLAIWHANAKGHFVTIDKYWEANRADELEAENEALQKELEELQMAFDALWLTANWIEVTLWAILAFFGLCLFSKICGPFIKMFGKGAAVSHVLQEQKETLIIVHAPPASQTIPTPAAGVSMLPPPTASVLAAGGPPSGPVTTPAVAVSAGAVSVGSTDEALRKRIQELELQVMDLASEMAAKETATKDSNK